MGLIWAILLFATPVIFVLGLGAVALRIFPAGHSGDAAPTHDLA